MRIEKRLILLLCLAALTLAAQETRLAGPVSGFLFDPQARAVRSIQGVLGASYLGEAVAADLEYASVAPNGKYAVAVRQDGVLLLRGLDQGIIAESALEGAAAGVTRAVWSADSTAVALWGDAGRVQVWTDLASTPRLALAADAGEIAAVAVASEGRGLVVAARSGAILVASEGAALRAILQLEQPTALALAGNRLFVADAARNEILSIGDYRKGGDAQMFANTAGGVEDPVALAVSPDRSRLYAASRSKRTLTAFQVGTAEVAGVVELDFEPTRLEQFSASCFSLTGGGDGAPIQVLDSARALAVYFVPAGPASEMED
jgi:hypothetical protein